MDIYRAFAQATSQYPYYARVFAAMTPVHVSDDILDSFAVDEHWRLYYSSAAIKRFQYVIPQVIRHEAEHLLREHDKRRENREQHGWNVAADAEINDDIAGLPPTAVFPSSIHCDNGKTAEYYYEHCRGQQTTPLCAGGSGVDGIQRRYEYGNPSDNSPGVPGEERPIVIGRVADDVQRYHNQHPGTVPDSVLVWANLTASCPAPRICWKRVIAMKLRKICNGCSDFTFGRISRRQNPGDTFLLPASFDRLPSIGIVVDTSGSMSNMGNEVAGAVRCIRRMSAGVIDLIACDADVRNVVRLRSLGDVESMLGGGGTDMRAGIEYAVAYYDLVIVLTDGYTPYPDHISDSVCILVFDSEWTVRCDW